ncbi:MAG: hypothetical protein LBM98_01885 [Oscillospiraceae bacterium]|jgi:hypothetical protein|nr:hypothetical protein [Oscillospiraceae bacterium]
MKKLLTLILALALTLLLVACSGGADSGTSASPVATPEATPAATPEATPAATPEATPEAPATEAPEAPDASGGGLSGSTSEILDSVLALGNEALGADDSLPMTFPSDVTADNSQNMLGLDADQFGTYVAEAVAHTAAISTTPYEVALIRCNDSDAAAEVRKLVAAGFDSNKWICVIPDESFVMQSGEYVFLGVARAGEALYLKEGFAEIAGISANDADVFFTKA